MTVQSHSLRLADIVAIAGHPFRYVHTLGGFNICRECCKTERVRFALDELWFVRSDRVNRSDVPVFCDHCSKSIPSKP